MTLLEVKAELSKTNELLERLVIAVERAVGPVAFEDEEPRKIRRTEPQDIGRVQANSTIKYLDKLKQNLEAGKGK